MAPRKKKVLLLGSTGSIGKNTLRVLDRFPQCFELVGISAYEQWQEVVAQAKAYKVKYAAVSEKHTAHLKNALKGTKTKILSVEQDLSFLAALPKVDIVVIAMSGRWALEPFLSAVKAGKQIAPANKEALVIAGEIIMEVAKKSGSCIVPIDSEQSAIFQCLAGQNQNPVDKIYLTASGGALLKVEQKQFPLLKRKDILSHPRWNMGPKITVDSATLMNKGFEVIEAQRLFGLNLNQIEIVIHPQAIVHSMVGFKDGSILAQLGITDMRLPIQYALTYPQRWDSGMPALNFAKIKSLEFASPDLKKFPCLGLALHAAKVSGTMPAVLNAADEMAVMSFLKEEIKFVDIFRVVENVVMKHKSMDKPTLRTIKDSDSWARVQAQEQIRKLRV